MSNFLADFEAVVLSGLVEGEKMKSRLDLIELQENAGTASTLPEMATKGWRLVGRTLA